MSSLQKQLASKNITGNGTSNPVEHYGTILRMNSLTQFARSVYIPFISCSLFAQRVTRSVCLCLFTRGRDCPIGQLDTCPGPSASTLGPVHSTRTELTCSKSTQLRDAFIGHARHRHDYSTAYSLAAMELGRLAVSSSSSSFIRSK